MILRIEDTDKARSTDEHTQVILDGLRWLGIPWDEGPFFQGANADRHRADVARMLASGHAYRCFCTPELIEQQRKAALADGLTFQYDRRCRHLTTADVEQRLSAGAPFTVRCAVPDGEVAWDDAVHGTISFQGKDLDDFIVLRTDGSAIYNMAVVSDDVAMAITHVIRGDDHISNTPKQILIYGALGEAQPIFGHVPMILGSDGKKLSKRHGATAVGDYQHEGILPAAMCNFLALMGWSPGGDREIMTRDEMVSLFSTEGLLRKAAVFDTKKLEWMNGQYLSLTPAAELDPIVRPMIVESGLATSEQLDARRDWWLSLLDLLRVRARTTHDIARQAATYFSNTVDYDADAVAKHWKDATSTASILRATRDRLAATEWNPAAMEEALRKLAEETGVSGGKVFQPLRVALVGQLASPGIFDVLMVLGRENSLARIEAAVERLG